MPNGIPVTTHAVPDALSNRVALLGAVARREFQAWVFPDAVTAWVEFKALVPGLGPADLCLSRDVQGGNSLDAVTVRGPRRIGCEGPEMLSWSASGPGATPRETLGTDRIRILGMFSDGDDTCAEGFVDGVFATLADAVREAIQHGQGYRGPLDLEGIPASKAE